jgi:hypothetical protein
MNVKLACWGRCFLSSLFLWASKLDGLLKKSKGFGYDCHLDVRRPQHLTSIDGDAPDPAYIRPQ